jgi:hypothetical protein
MPKYIYKGNVDFIEPSLELWIIKPNQVIEVQRDLPKHLIDSGLFEKISDEPYPITDKDEEYDLLIGQSIEVLTENEKYNAIEILVLPKTDSLRLNITKRQIVYIYQNYKSDENKLITELGGKITINLIQPPTEKGRNIEKLIIESDSQNEIDLKVRIHKFRAENEILR